MKKETYDAIEKHITWKRLMIDFIDWTSTSAGRGYSKLELKNIHGDVMDNTFKINLNYFGDYCDNFVNELKQEIKVYNSVIAKLNNLNETNVIYLDNIRYLSDITSNILFYNANPVFKKYSSSNFTITLTQARSELIYKAVYGYVENMKTAEDVFFAKDILTNALKVFNEIFTADQMISIEKKLFEVLPAEFAPDLITYIDFDKASNNDLKNEFLAEVFDYYVFKDVEISKKGIEFLLNSFNNESSFNDEKLKDLIDKFFLQKGFSALIEYSNTTLVKKYFEEIFKNYISHTTDFSNDIQTLAQYKFNINYLDENLKEIFTNKLIKLFEENRINSELLKRENKEHQGNKVKFSNDTTNLSIIGNANINNNNIYNFLSELNTAKETASKKEIEKTSSINNLLCLDFLGNYNKSLISKEILENYLNKKLLENNLNVKDIITLLNNNVKNIKLDEYFNKYLKSEDIKIIKDFSLKETNEVLKNFLKNCSQETFTLFSEKLLLELQKESDDKVILNFLSQTNDFKAHKQLKSFFEEKLSQEHAIKKYFSGIKSNLIDYNDKTYFCKLNWKNIINKYIDSANMLDKAEANQLFELLKYNYIPGLNNKAFLLKAFDKLEKDGASLDDTIYFNEAIGVNTSSIMPELKEKIKEKLFATSIDEYVNLKRISSICTFMRLNFTDEEKLKFFEKFFKDENIVSLSTKGSIKTILESITENAPIRYDLMTTTDGINFHNKYFYKFFANNLNNFIASGKANQKDYVPTIDVTTHNNIIENSFGVETVLKSNTNDGTISQYNATIKYDYKLLNNKHISNSQDFKDYYIRKTLNLLIPVFNTKENINFQIEDSDKLIIITNDKENLIPQKRINAKDEEKVIIASKDESLFVEIFPFTAAVKKPGISLFEKTEINKCENKVLENLANHYIEITQNFLERMQYENEQNKFKEKVSEIISTLDYFADEFSDLKTEILTDGLDENCVFIPYIDNISSKIEDVTNYILNGKSFDNKTNIKIENIFNDSLPIIKKAINDYTLFLRTKNENTTNDLQNEMDQLLKTFVRYSDSIIFKIDDVINNEMEWNARDINASMRVRTVRKESDFKLSLPTKKEPDVLIKPSENKVKIESAYAKDFEDLASVIEKEKQTNLCIQKLAQIITSPEENKNMLRKELYTQFSNDIINSITSEMIMNYLEAKQKVELSKINSDLNKD